MFIVCFCQFKSTGTYLTIVKINVNSTVPFKGSAPCGFELYDTIYKEMAFTLTKIKHYLWYVLWNCKVTVDI